MRFGAGGPQLEALDRLADAYDAVRDEIDLAQAPEPVTDTPFESAALVHRLALVLAAGAFVGVCAERGDDRSRRTRSCARRASAASRTGSPVAPAPSSRTWWSDSWRYAVDRTDRGIRLTISTRDDAPHPAPEEGDIR